MFRRLCFGTSRLTHEYHHHQRPQRYICLSPTITLTYLLHNIFTTHHLGIPSLYIFLTARHCGTILPQSRIPQMQRRGLLRWRKARTCVRPINRHMPCETTVTGQVTAKPLTNMSKQIDSGWSRTRADRSLQLRGLEAQGSLSWASRPPKYFSSDFDWAKLLGVFRENSEWNGLYKAGRQRMTGKITEMFHCMWRKEEIPEKFTDVSIVHL